MNFPSRISNVTFVLNVCNRLNILAQVHRWSKVDHQGLIDVFGGFKLSSINARNYCYYYYLNYYCKDTIITLIITVVCNLLLLMKKLIFGKGKIPRQSSGVGKIGRQLKVTLTNACQMP